MSHHPLIEAILVGQPIYNSTYINTVIVSSCPGPKDSTRPNRAFSARVLTIASPRSWQLTTHGHDQRLHRPRPAPLVTCSPSSVDRSVVLRVRRPDDTHRRD